jgi:2-C-methyl-D-erythritol 4-phosphate cytidylyltransferase
MEDSRYLASAIIVAAGSGTRMGSPVAKQFIRLGGMPIISRTLKVFAAHPCISGICLVVPEKDMDFCQKNILPYVDGKINIRITAGGDQRQDSVYRGLKAMGLHESLVVIHDGVRPFVSPETIEACIYGAARYGACIAGIPVSDTLKRVSSDKIITETVSRDCVWMAQTPQAFDWDIIMKAFEKAASDGFLATDDSSLVQRLGISVHVVQGSRRNIKITTPDDLRAVKQFFDTNT